MTLAEPSGLSQDWQARSLGLRSALPVMPAEAMVRQAEIDAAYLTVEAARADPMYQADLQAKATEARERAHRLRAAIAAPMPSNAGALLVDFDAREALAERLE
jgi:hypothetical protein